MNDSMTDRLSAGLRKSPLLVVVFLAVTFAVTWLAFLPLILRRTHTQSTTGTLLVLGIGAPSITAFVLTALSAAGRESGDCGVVGPDGGSARDGMRPC